jgi:hypothetical protein
MKQRYKLNSALLIAVVTLITFSANAQREDVEYNWEEKKNKDGISISISKVEGSKFKAVRGVMTIKGTAKALVAMVEDLPACSKWASLCKESRIEKRISDTENYVYVYNDIPFPVADRDVYTRVVWKQDELSGKVSMTSMASTDEDSTPKKKGVIRIKDAMSQWHFTPKSDGMVLVENFAHIDPGGATPAWLTNVLLIDSPFKTMSKMRKIIESGEYANSEVSFLK